MLFYEIKPIQMGRKTYFAVFDNESDTSSRLFKSYMDAWDAMVRAVNQAPDDEPPHARNIH